MRHGFWLLAALASGLAGAPAAAICYESGDAAVESLMQDVARNPDLALDTIAEAIEASPVEEYRHRAWLVATRSAARGMSGHADDEVIAFTGDAEQRLEADDPLLINLQIAMIDASARSAEEVLAVADALAAILHEVEDFTAAHACAASSLAYMLSLADKPAEAFTLASRAYAASPRASWARAEAATALAQVVNQQSDGEYSVQLSTEALAYFEASGFHDLSANAVNLRGWAHVILGDVEAAIADFNRSIEFANMIGNTYAVSYARAGLCEVLTEFDRLDEAGPVCRIAYEDFMGSHGVARFRNGALYGTYLVKSGQPEQSIAVLSPLLEEDQGRLGATYRAVALKSRARAFALLGQYERAYQDIDEAEALQTEAVREDQEVGTAIARARFKAEQLRLDLMVRTHQLEMDRVRSWWILTGALVMVFCVLVVALAIARNRRFFREQAYRDELTGLPNRRYADMQLQTLYAHAVSRNEPLTLAILDLDHFKSCNDRFGHGAGDDALRRFAEVGRRSVRPGDLLGRWGGEEFLLVLPGTGKDDAALILERLRAVLVAETLDTAPDYRLRFSAGAVEASGRTLHDALVAADEALYRAKAAGRNRSEFAPPEEAGAPG